MPIKRPVIGDTDYLEVTMLTRTSRNKTRVAVNNSNWYGSERFSIVVRNLTEVAKNNFVNTMQANAGILMYYVDHRSVVWDVVILTPFNKVVQEGRGERYNISYEMEATLHA